MNVTGQKTRWLVSIAVLASQMCGASLSYAQNPGDGLMPRTAGNFEAPTGPTTPQRPSSWPGGNNQLPPSQGGPVQGARYPTDQLNTPAGAPPMQVAQVPPGQQPPFVGQPPYAQVANRPAAPAAPLPRQAFEAGRQAARVGNEIILAGDVMAKVNEDIVTRKVPKEYWDQFREQRFPQILYTMVQEKMIVCDARRSIPKEAFPNIEKSVFDQFDKTQLPKLMKDEGVENPKDLENKLKARGTSLAAQKQAFFDKSISQQWAQNSINRKKEVPVLQMNEYYRNHAKEYQFAAKARWEEIMVETSKFPDKAKAFSAIAVMGNDVLHGANFAEVAKRGSNGSTASEGGMHDWTGRGSLASDAIDQALFTLPVGSMSQIIESDRGFHIVRVTERTEAGQKPFEEVQSEIRKTLEEESYKKQVKDFLTKLKEKTEVWTMYDEKGGLVKVLGIKDEDQ